MRRSSGSRCVLWLCLLCVKPATEAQQPAPTRSSSSTSAGDALAQAREQLQHGTPEQAEATVRKLLLTAPTSADAHFLLGYILFREIQEHAADAANLADVQREQAFINLRDQHARDSLAQYTEAARYHAPSAFDLKIVALNYILLNDYPDADKWLTKSLAWNPHDEQSWYYEGRIKYKQAQYAQAIDALQHALSLNPKDVTAEDNLGLAFQGLGKTPDAITAFRTAIRWAQAANSADNGPWIDLGSLLTEQGRAQEAIPYLTEAAKIDPSDVRAHEQLAAAYRAANQWPAVQRELELAVKLSPNTASLHFMLGQAYRRNGEPAKATAETQRSAALEAETQSAARATEPH